VVIRTPKTVNPKIKLALVAASAVGAASSLIGQIPAALAGPTLTGISNQTFNASATYNLQAGESFQVSGATNGFTPFAVTTGALTGAAGTNSGAAFALGTTLGNAGTSTLTAAFDRNGFGNSVNTGSTLATPSFAVQAGVINLGGTGGTGGITTIASSNQFNTPTSLAFNQGTTSGISSITVAANSSPTGITGVTINSQLIGATTTTGTLSDTFQVINSLSAF